MSLCVTEQLPTKTTKMHGEMLSDLVSVLDASVSAGARKRRTREHRRMEKIRCVVSHIIEMWKLPPELIRIGDLAACGFDAEFSTYLRTRLKTRHAVYDYMSY